MQRTKRTSPSDGIELDGKFRPLTCPNCGTDRQGEYCHGCGQRFLKDRLTAWELWWIFADRFLDWEEGVWRTFLKMAKAPGVVIRNYLGGMRKTYLNPFSYLLFCAGLYALGQFVMGKIAGMAALPGVQEMQELGMALDQAEDQFTVIAYGTVAVVALLALSMRIMFDGRHLNAMEAVVATIYTAGNVFILSLGVSIFEFVLTGDPIPLYGPLGAAVLPTVDVGSFLQEAHPAYGLIEVFAVLFPICMAHAGYGLFESWKMAGYTGVTPVVAALFGGGFVLVGYGALFMLVVSVGSLFKGIMTGGTENLVGGFAALFLLLLFSAPILAPYFVD